MGQNNDYIYWDDTWNMVNDKEKMCEEFNKMFTKPSTGTYNWIEQLKNKQNNDTHK